MRSLCYFPVLFFICLGCSRPFSITASVNNSRWFGSGLANKIDNEKTATCQVKRFGLTVITDIPYGTPNQNRASGCKGDCIPTQILDFYNIPLLKGKYDLTRQDPCLPSNLRKVQFSQLKSDPNGAHILKGTSVSVTNSFIEGPPNCWIRVTNYNAASGLVKGKFELRLVNKQGETLNVKNGKFRVNL